MSFMRRTLFFLLMPIFVPLALFLYYTYDWWVSLSEAGRFKKIFFFILLPFYVPLSLFLNVAFGPWTSLAD